MSHGIHLTDGPLRRPVANGNPLLRKIQRCCRMSLPEPDLALNLDVADYINEKQGAAPREAVIAISRLVNTRDTHTAVFALALLDVLVKNCGYPLHLQISRKEFLNDLVKTFPEHPPMRYSKVQRLILTAIEEWYQTICKHSSYKEDMGYIRDMHRLLKYKGYAFPKIDESQLAVLRPNDSLKTASELQKEQEISQAAKLEELIRRGRPEDLKEANKLMKVMAGFKEDNAKQVKDSIQTELKKLKRKCDLLNDMLSSSENPDLKNETIEELYGSLKAAQPKFQKIIEEEQEDDTLVQDLLVFNDIVNQTLEKYNLLKSGKSSEAAQIQPSSMSSSIEQNNSGALANEINLIDFDNNDEPSSASPNTATPSTTSNIDPLADLLGDLNSLDASSKPSDSTVKNFGFGGSITLGSSTPAAPITTGATSAPSQTSDFDLLGGSSTGQSSPSGVTVSKSEHLQIDFRVKRTDPSTVHIKALFSNVSNAHISEFTFMVAVPKSMTLDLKPQSADDMSALKKEGITQDAVIKNSLTSSTKPLKIKWKATYKVNGIDKEESAVYTLPNTLTSASDSSILFG